MRYRRYCRIFAAVALIVGPLAYAEPANSAPACNASAGRCWAFVEWRRNDYLYGAWNGLGLNLDIPTTLSVDNPNGPSLGGVSGNLWMYTLPGSSTYLEIFWNKGKLCYVWGASGCLADDSDPRWVWGDKRPDGSYWNHVIGSGYLGQGADVAFQWEHNSTWTIWFQGGVVGYSYPQNCCGYLGQVGMELHSGTTGSTSTAWANDFWWADLSGNWFQGWGWSGGSLSKVEQPSNSPLDADWGTVGWSAHYCWC